MLILGIESSCDETAAAVVRDGSEIVSSIISSQIDLHKPFGGVMPELASREHLTKIRPIVENALDEAGVEASDIDAVAVTQGPGLVGSLLVGVCFAKAYAAGLNVPLVAVNHIEGHFFSVAFENPPIKYPALALIVSGGHTNLFAVPEEGKYKVVSRTRDDAAGEAFDKVGKMLGLPYPGGPVIELVAIGGDPSAIKFTRPKISDGRPDFSFSGLKTAVSKILKDEAAPMPEAKLANLAASFQNAVIEQLTRAVEKSIDDQRPETLIVAGGVACNAALRNSIDEVGKRRGIPVYFPSKHLSTDNAAMIAAAGYVKLMRGETESYDISADVTLRLQNLDNNDAKLRNKVHYRL